MSTMQSQMPPPTPSPVMVNRSLSPMAANSLIGSLVAFFGVILVIAAGGFVMLASYILRSALMMQWTSATHDVIPVYMTLAIVPSICAIVTFIFGLRVVAKGLGKLTQHPGMPPG